MWIKYICTARKWPHARRRKVTGCAGKGYIENGHATDRLWKPDDSSKNLCSNGADRDRSFHQSRLFFCLFIRSRDCESLSFELK